MGVIAVFVSVAVETRTGEGVGACGHVVENLIGVEGLVPVLGHALRGGGERCAAPAAAAACEVGVGEEHSEVGGAFGLDQLFDIVFFGRPEVFSGFGKLNG